MSEDVERCLSCMFGKPLDVGGNHLAECLHSYRVGPVGVAGSVSVGCVFYKKKPIVLPCLSIRQPWAWAILHAGKDYENRTWKTSFRGVFLIHAGKIIDSDGYDTIDYIHGSVPLGDLPVGGIVGIAEITDCVEKSDSEWFFGPYGFKIENSMKLPFYPCKGKLSLYKQEYPHKEIIDHYILTKGF